MKIEEIAPGDILTYWYDAGGGRCMGPTICYAKVVRVNRVTVSVMTEHHGVKRVAPHHFNRKIAKGQWSPFNAEIAE